MGSTARSFYTTGSWQPFPGQEEAFIARVGGVRGLGRGARGRG